MRVRRTAVAIGCVATLLLAGCQPEPGTVHESYQGNAANTGSIPTPIAADPSVRWSHTFDGTSTVASPLMVGDLVVAPLTRGGGWENEARVVAFDRATGSIRWEQAFPGADTVQVAARDHRIFVQVDYHVHALDRDEGSVLWTRYLDGLRPRHAPTPASDGLYVFGYSGTAGRLEVIDLATGRTRWARRLEQTSGSSTPAVSGSTVYVASVCGHVVALDRSDGRQRWRHIDGCYGGGSADPVVRNGRVYNARTELNRDDTGYILDERTGARLNTFRSRTTPIVGEHSLILTNGRGLENWTADGRTRRWRTELPDVPSLQPVAVGGTVVTAVEQNQWEWGSEEFCPASRPTESTLVGVRAADGRTRFSLPLGLRCQRRNTYQYGIAAADGIIAVPLGNRLVVVA